MNGTDRAESADLNPRHAATIARRKLNASPDWQLCAWRRVGPDGLMLSGGVPRIVERGPNKGCAIFGVTEDCLVVQSEVDLEASLHAEPSGDRPLKVAAGIAEARCGNATPFTEPDLRRTIFAAAVGAPVPISLIACMRAFLEDTSAAALTRISYQMEAELAFNITEFKRAIRVLRDELSVPLASQG